MISCRPAGTPEQSLPSRTAKMRAGGDGGCSSRNPSVGKQLSPPHCVTTGVICPICLCQPYSTTAEQASDLPTHQTYGTIQLHHTIQQSYRHVTARSLIAPTSHSIAH